MSFARRAPFALFFAACAAPDGGPAVARDDDPVLADRDELLAGAPDPDSIPSEWKADGVLPAAFDLAASQTPVKSQGRRGVCSIFSSLALMEHLYLLEGSTAAPDFSEQYLQWSTKRLLGAFPSTSGSSNTVNLSAIHQFGVPLEADWPYEIEQWDQLDDPECGGEDPQPTKCYTNGEPPPAAEAADKFFLPAGRWLSRSDLKSFMHTKGQAVSVGFDFFYQAWNHRLSTLPTTPENWNAGVVLYPNAEDVTASLMERAGHAILLIGWDDDLEVAQRDKDGNVVLDAAGAPVMEKGFYLFKNSWGTAGFGIDHPFGPGYGWIAQRYIHDYASARISDLPELGGAGGELVFEGPAGQSIPDADPTGVRATIEVADPGTIASLRVAVAIDHSFRGDLVVTLAHGDTSVVLHDRAGGSLDDLDLAVDLADFAGQVIAGPWTLTVVDRAAADVGSLTSWSLTATLE